MLLSVLNNPTFITVVLLIIAYLIGSIPIGLIVGLKTKNIDIREHGSKNIGATNAIRVLGKKIGLTVFILDVLKGAHMIIVVKYILGPLGVWEFPYEHFVIIFGITAILGHVLPIYLKFKGGKAVACSLGVVLSLTPIPALLCLIVFLITIYSTGYVSLGSTFATITVFTSAVILNFIGLEDNLLLGKPGWFVCLIYFVLGGLIIYKHKNNYKRLLNGTENNFKKKKKEEEKNKN